MSQNLLYSQVYKSFDTLNFTNPDSVLIAEVNYRSLQINMIHSEGELAIRTPSMDESGSIEIKAKKLDDLWYRIHGSFAVFSKDAFIGHFNRKNFIYVNNLNETIITGKTNDTNIGYITRIKCCFDDIMNVMTGTCHIALSERDDISSETDGSETVITVKSYGGKDLKDTLILAKEMLENGRTEELVNSLNEFIRMLEEPLKKNILEQTKGLDLIERAKLLIDDSARDKSMISSLIESVDSLGRAGILTSEKIRKYWINRNEYLVTKYIQYNDKKEVYLSVEFFNFVNTAGASYAKKIIIQRPAKREKLTLILTSVRLNQSNLSFRVELPSDYRRVKW